MEVKKLEKVIGEIERFLSRAKELETVRSKQASAYYNSNPKEQGAVRRASMDLTRALADLRKSDFQ